MATDCGGFLTANDSTFDLFQLKIGIPVTRALGNVHANFDFSTLFFAFTTAAAAP